MTIAAVVGLPAGVRVPGVGVRGRTLKKRFPSLAYHSFPHIAASAFIINEPPLVSCPFARSKRRGRTRSLFGAV